MEQLNTVFQAASEEMYKAQQESQAAQPDAGTNGNSSGEDGEVTDVDFEDVTDEKKDGEKEKVVEDEKKDDEKEKVVEDDKKDK
ncbi:MAG TPA: hypothetical protein EYN38_08875 [Flavobacteriales bacterium]|nr:hypothetical protein [Flavobacteriales bacterium]